MITPPILFHSPLDAWPRYRFDDERPLEQPSFIFVISAALGVCDYQDAHEIFRHFDAGRCIYVHFSDTSQLTGFAARAFRL